MHTHASLSFSFSVSKVHDNKDVTGIVGCFCFGWNPPVLFPFFFFVWCNLFFFGFCFWWKKKAGQPARSDQTWLRHFCFLTAFFLFLFGGFGITGGAHRLWAHRCYKAKWPLRLLAGIAQTIAVQVRRESRCCVRYAMILWCMRDCVLQNDIYEWSRDHRVHHKFSETDADPHNARRGFFFAHVGWLLCKKHPEVLRRGKTVDCSDLLEDPIVVYQRKWVCLSLFRRFPHPQTWTASWQFAFKRPFSPSRPFCHQTGSMCHWFWRCASLCRRSFLGITGASPLRRPSSSRPSSATYSRWTSPGWSTALPTYGAPIPMRSEHLSSRLEFVFFFFQFYIIAVVSSFKGGSVQPRTSRWRSWRRAKVGTITTTSFRGTTRRLSWATTAWTWRPWPSISLPGSDSLTTSRPSPTGSSAAESSGRATELIRTLSKTAHSLRVTSKKKNSTRKSSRKIQNKFKMS